MLLSALFAGLLSAMPTLTTAADAVAASSAPPRVLVYTATAGYRHDSIPTAIEVLGQHASAHNVDFVFSE